MSESDEWLRVMKNAISRHKAHKYVVFNNPQTYGKCLADVSIEDNLQNKRALEAVSNWYKKFGKTEIN